MPNNKIEMFNTHNDTDNWIVCIDGFFGTFSTRKEAAEVYNLIGKIDDSPFGSCEWLPPQFKHEYIDNHIPTCKISNHQAINIRDYITKSYERSNINYEMSRIKNPKTAKEKLAEKRGFDYLFS